MHITRRSFVSSAAASAGLLTTGISPLRAAGYPERDITLIVPWAAGDGPPWAFDGVDGLRRGHAVEAGVATVLDPFAASPTLDVSLAERVVLPGIGATAVPFCRSSPCGSYPTPVTS